jgi:hypothetical protein
MKTPTIGFALMAAALPAAVLAQPLDFLQIDAGRRTATLVAVKALRGMVSPPAPAPLLSAVYSDFSTGHAASVAYTHRWAVVQGTHGVLVGAGVGGNRFRSRDVPADNEEGFSLRGQAEAYGPVVGGSYYALLQASTFRNAWLALVQYAPGGWPVAFEISRQQQVTYQATTSALRFSTGVERWFVRVGVVRAEEEYRPFVGITFNAF